MFTLLRRIGRTLMESFSRATGRKISINDGYWLNPVKTNG